MFCSCSSLINKRTSQWQDLKCLLYPTDTLFRRRYYHDMFFSLFFEWRHNKYKTNKGISDKCWWKLSVFPSNSHMKWLGRSGDIFLLFTKTKQKSKNAHIHIGWSKNACSYLGHIYPQWQRVDDLSGNKGCLSEGCDGASLWVDDKESLKIHQNTAISSTDQGLSDEEVGLTGTHQ